MLFVFVLVVVTLVIGMRNKSSNKLTLQNTASAIIFATFLYMLYGVYMADKDCFVSGQVKLQFLLKVRFKHKR